MAKNDNNINLSVYEELTKYIDKLGDISFSNYKSAITFINDVSSLVRNDSDYLDDIIRLINDNEKINEALSIIITWIKRSKNGDRYEILDSIIMDDIAKSFIDIYMNINLIDLDDELGNSSYLNDNIVIQYLNDIMRYPLLDALEEQLLGILLDKGASDEKRAYAKAELQRKSLEENKKLSVLKAKNKEEEIKYAKEDFITHNLRLVVSYAKRYVNKGLDYMDLVQSGNMGLGSAAERFDYKKGNRFSTYAIWWIRQAILRDLCYYGKMIRRPINIDQKVAKYKQVYSNYVALNEKEPTDEELLKILGDGWSAQLLSTVRFIEKDVISLETPIGEDEDSFVADFIPSDVNVENEVGNNMVSKSVDDLLNNSGLSEKQIDVLKRRFGIGYGFTQTLEEIGAEYGVTRERVRQIEMKALRALRSHKKDFAFISDSDSIFESNNNHSGSKNEGNLFRCTPKKIETKKYLFGIDAKSEEDKLWNRYYLILKAYKKHYGNLNLDFNFSTSNGVDYNKNGYNIYSWLKEEKIKYEDGKLRKDKFEALSELGVSFNHEKRMFKKLEDFIFSKAMFTFLEQDEIVAWLFSQTLELKNSSLKGNDDFVKRFSTYGYNVDWTYKLYLFMEFLKTCDDPNYFENCLTTRNNKNLSVMWFKNQFQLYSTCSLNPYKSALIRYVCVYQNNLKKDYENKLTRTLNNK